MNLAPPAPKRTYRFALAVDARRTYGEGKRLRPDDNDDLDDPYGMPDQFFARTADVNRQ
jgi:hypothetical protein